MDRELQQYILERINIDLIGNGCREWIRGRTTRGYGAAGNSKWHKLYGKGMAHQLSYIAWNGIYPKELHVLHKCHNRKCVNPQHLYVGTQKENMIDRDLAGRGVAPKGSAHGRAKLTEGDIIIIKGLLDKLSQRKIALIYGVAQKTISNISTSKTWNHV